jgi:hypothetical protein
MYRAAIHWPIHTRPRRLVPTAAQTATPLEAVGTAIGTSVVDAAIRASGALAAESQSPAVFSAAIGGTALLTATGIASVGGEAALRGAALLDAWAMATSSWDVVGQVPGSLAGQGGAPGLALGTVTAPAPLTGTAAGVGGVQANAYALASIGGIALAVASVSLSGDVISVVDVVGTAMSSALSAGSASALAVASGSTAAGAVPQGGILGAGSLSGASHADATSVLSWTVLPALLVGQSGGAAIAQLAASALPARASGTAIATAACVGGLAGQLVYYAVVAMDAYVPDHKLSTAAGGGIVIR